MRGEYPPHGAHLLWASERYGRSPEEFIDFSSNVNPLGPPASALESAKKALEWLSRYPEPCGESLKDALAGHLALGKEMIALGNGSTELIYHLCQCLQPSRVLVVNPSFGEYERAAKAIGAEVDYFDLSWREGFALHAHELAKAVGRKELIFFCNPASPTGVLYPRELILPVLQVVRELEALLVVDESFMGFASEREARDATMLGEVIDGGVAVLSSLTKLYALAGVRGPGYLVAKEALISELERRYPPWRVNVVAAAAAEAAIGDKAYLDLTRKRIRTWREEFISNLEQMGCFKVFPSCVNFFLLRVIRCFNDAMVLTDYLGRRGILIRYAGNFRGLDSRFLRVAVRNPRDNGLLIEALKESLSPG